MIWVAELLYDPDLSQPFTVERSVGSFGPGGWAEGSPISIPLNGVIYPTTQAELQQVPEGDRVTGMATFASPLPLYLTHASGVAGTSDRITWHGNVYKLVHLFDYGDYGAWAAAGVRVTGA